MAYSDPKMQKAIGGAKARAQAELTRKHQSEYDDLYEAEMRSEGYVRTQRGRGLGWRAMTPEDDPNDDLAGWSPY